MKARNGKIARLPLEIREQINTRLADGEPGNRLVEWLNSNPAVMKVMQEQFDGRPINENNISEWRQGGYEEWLVLRSFLDESHVLSENAGEIADTGISSDHLHMVLLAHHAHLLQNWMIMPEDEFKKKLDALRKLTASIMNMRRAELQKARVQLQRERLELLREMQTSKSAASSPPSTKTATSTRSTAGSKQSDSESRHSSFELRHSSHPAGPSVCSPPSTPLFSVPAKKSALKSPPLTGRIQPDVPQFVTHAFCDPLFPAIDPLECTEWMRHTELPRSAKCMQKEVSIALNQSPKIAA